MTTETYFYKLNNEMRTVTRAPKQRLIQIHQVCDNGHNGINFTAHKEARSNLSKNAFELYDYLEFLPDGIVWAMSSSNLYKESALKEKTYSLAFQELLDKGYLFECPIKVADGVVKYDAYHFYEDNKLNPRAQFSHC